MGATRPTTRAARLQDANLLPIELPSLTPAVNAAHSAGVNANFDPSGFLESSYPASISRLGDLDTVAALIRSRERFGDCAVALVNSTARLRSTTGPGDSIRTATLPPHLSQQIHQLLILSASSQPTQLLPILRIAVPQDVATHRERRRKQRRRQKYGPILNLRLGHRNSPFKMVG